MTLTATIDYSIIICAYNPDKNLFGRCLRSISELSATGLSIEVIIVDNNSTVALNQEEYVHDFLSKMPVSKLLLVKEQGLNYARKAGIEEAAGSNIIFFDDDNEPDSNYILVLDSLNKAYPSVGVWGPGSINVDFVNGVSKSLEEYALSAFQQRNESAVIYSNQRTWQPCYPFGTGFCLKKELLEEYISLVEQKKFTIVDRKGEQMTSAGDTQMVLFCVSRGVAAGVAPDLKLTHIIPAKRTTFEYLKRLAYGTSVCYSRCVSEINHDYVPELKRRVLSERKFVTKTFKKYLSLYFTSKPEKTLDLITYIGAIAGEYLVLDKQVPSFVGWVLKQLDAVKPGE